MLVPRLSASPMGCPAWPAGAGFCPSGSLKGSLRVLGVAAEARASPMGLGSGLEGSVSGGQGLSRGFWDWAANGFCILAPGDGTSAAGLLSSGSCALGWLSCLGSSVVGCGGWLGTAGVTSGACGFDGVFEGDGRFADASLLDLLEEAPPAAAPGGRGFLGLKAVAMSLRALMI